MARACAEWQSDFWRALDGDVSAAEQRPLVEHLRGCPGCVSVCGAAVRLHRVLLEAHLAPVAKTAGFPMSGSAATTLSSPVRPGSSARRAAVSASRASPRAPGSHPATRTAFPESPAWWRGWAAWHRAVRRAGHDWRRRGLWAAAAGVMLCAAAYCVAALNGWTRGAPVGTVIHVVLPDGSSQSPVVTWETLLGTQRLALQAGVAVRLGDRLALPPAATVGIRCDDGTRLELSEAAALRFEGRAHSGTRVVLDRGRLAAEVVPQPPGAPWVAATPHAVATALGTRLALKAAPAATRLEVMDGKVRLTRLTDAASVDVPAGYCAVVATGAAPAAWPNQPQPPLPEWWRPERSVARAYRREGRIAIDGVLSPGEWPAASRLRLLEFYDRTGVSRHPSFVYLAWDDERLYLAALNEVADDAVIRGTDERDEWGKDCVEFGFQAVQPDGALGRLYAFRGYPSGRHTAWTDEFPDVLPEQARPRPGVAFAAAVKAKQWVAEFGIPWQALEADPRRVSHFRFSLGVGKDHQKEWLAWVSTKGNIWKADGAGLLVLRPEVSAGSPNLLANGDFESGPSPAGAWRTFPATGSGSARARIAEDPAEGRCATLESRDGSRAGLAQQVSVAKPGLYLLAFHVQPRSLARIEPRGGFTIRLAILDGAGVEIERFDAGRYVIGEGDFYWRRHEIPMVLPPWAARVDVAFELAGAIGTVRVDDVVLRACEGMTGNPEERK